MVDVMGNVYKVYDVYTYGIRSETLRKEREVVRLWQNAQWCYLAALSRDRHDVEGVSWFKHCSELNMNDSIKGCCPGNERGNFRPRKEQWEKEGSEKREEAAVALKKGTEGEKKRKKAKFAVTWRAWSVDWIGCRWDAAESHGRQKSRFELFGFTETLNGRVRRLCEQIYRF